VFLFHFMLQSTGRSHSLSANFQEVLSLMKTHNSKLCAGPCTHSRITRRGSGLQAKSARACSGRLCERQCEAFVEPVTESVDELTGLILQLEEEFGQLTLYVPVTFSCHSAYIFLSRLVNLYSVQCYSENRRWRSGCCSMITATFPRMIWVHWPHWCIDHCNIASHPAKFFLLLLVISKSRIMKHAWCGSYPWTVLSLEQGLMILLWLLLVVIVVKLFSFMFWLCLYGWLFWLIFCMRLYALATRLLTVILVNKKCLLVFACLM